MEDVLQKARASAIKTIAERKELERRVGSLQADVQGWQQKAEVALLNGRDDLATEALEAKARTVAMLMTVERQLQFISTALARQDEDMEQLSARLHEAKVRERSLRSLHRIGESRLGLRKKTFDERVGHALVHFDRIEGALDEMEGKIESYDLGRTRELRTTLGHLAITTSVQDELADMRARLGNRVPLISTKA
jgi:phage shock protein A